MKKIMIKASDSIVASALLMPRLAKQILVLVIDACICVMTVWFAFCLRLGELVYMTGPVTLAAVSSVSLALPIFYKYGFYRAIFRYSGMRAMLILARAIALYGLIFGILFSIWIIDGIPKTVGLIQSILLLIFVGASRLIAQALLSISLNHKTGYKVSKRKTIIYGAGSVGRQLALAIGNSPEVSILAFLDDDNTLRGKVINGLVVYSPQDLDKILKDLEVTDIFLALPHLSRLKRNQILNILKIHKLAVRTLPALSNVAVGKIGIGDLHELDIDDLLGRDPVAPNQFLLSKNIYGKTVMVTGAGGSIGSELCRQILSSGPKRLLLLEMSESALYQIHKELTNFLSIGSTRKQFIQVAGLGEPINERDYPINIEGVEVIPLLASVCDKVRISEIMRAWKPETVYHAAAYKHVPLVEHNLIDGVRNNVFGTLTCALAAMSNGVCNFILVSTDKAVRPTNVMGATKRLSEMILQALTNVTATATHREDEFNIKTIFSMVRFGNVLGSSGSVVPLFREQIKDGGPITITHPEITRYFMTIPEAAQLVIQASAMGEGGDVFLLNMGNPVRIIDLAHRMVELSGLTVRDKQNPTGDIELVIVGLRPGEKLHEELLIGEDSAYPTLHPSIKRARESYLPWQDLQKKLNDLEAAINNNSVTAIRFFLKDLVTGYIPTNEETDWVQMVLKSGFEANNRV